MGEKRSKILVVGSINMDLVMDIDRFPKGGETILGHDYTYIPGGKGANQAVAAARLDGDVTFCGRIGKDANGDILFKNMEDNGIHTSFLKRDENLGTGLAVIPVEKSGENLIIVFASANSNLSKDDVDRALEKDYDAVMMQLEIPLDTAFYAFERAKAKGIPMVLDAGPAMKLDLSKLKGIHIISPNETEAEAITGIRVNDEKGALEASRIIQTETEASYVVIKMGDKGAFLYKDGKGEMFSSFKVKAVDTTAAGDSFTAAMTLKMAEGQSIEKAIEYANAVGAICVGRKGAQPSLPTRDEVEKFISSRL